MSVMAKQAVRRSVKRERERAKEILRTDVSVLVSALLYEGGNKLSFRFFLKPLKKDCEM